MRMFGHGQHEAAGFAIQGEGVDAVADGEHQRGAAGHRVQ
jgi:hypothetical protein